MKDITIGKYTLESLTSGMYIEPLILFREYIQNGADSIDEAIKEGILKKNDGFIKVTLKNNEIIIEDNGTGIRGEEVYKTLTDIGNSKKRFTSNKGFRGIGRLSGLSYCKKLVFETSFRGEDKKHEIIFDCVALNNLLIPGKYENYGIAEVLSKITRENVEDELESAHYMKIRLIDVNKKLGILDEEKVTGYIEETAPVPFDESKFCFGKLIKEKLEDLGLEQDEYNIYLVTDRINKKIYKPYKKKIYVDLNNRVTDEITDIEMKLITNDAKNKPIALVWYGKSSFKGTVVDNSIKGLRVRKSGLLIGDRFLLNPIFKEERFNGWVVGEVIIIDKGIIPNARRDDFEKNEEYIFLMNELKKIGKKITGEIREASKVRNTVASSTENIGQVVNKLNEKVVASASSEKLHETLQLFERVDKLFTVINERDVMIKKVEEALKNNKVNEEVIAEVISLIKL